jgi:2-polyprenyl-3-methyl-5-hydroxy-6-metoxy-1,4-benzoquinol methylase
MKPSSPSLFCPSHGEELSRNEEDSFFLCPEGCTFPLKQNIPRFVSSENYASSFGLQWNEFRLAQLDSFSGTTISRDRLKRLAGGSLDVFKGKLVLEAGCGAGRFTEIMLEAGASVWAVDLSSAVEANYENCRDKADYSVCQADILRLPFAPEQFDIVVCIGVIQHTENPERTIEALCSHVKPGGLLVIDHYTYGYAVTPSRRFLRSLLIRIHNKKNSLWFCKALVNTLWPMHTFLWKHQEQFPCIRKAFLRVSPVVDYHDAYPQIGPDLLRTWALLDTHDTLTDYYKHLRSKDEIEACLRNCGMIDIETTHAGNGVEARARKPEDLCRPTERSS